MTPKGWTGTWLDVTGRKGSASAPLEFLEVED